MSSEKRSKLPAAVSRPARQSVQVRVLEAVREAIFNGELQPGDPVTELHLAGLYGVSQTTVREAMAKLEHAGLVRRIPNRGTFVTKLSPREVREYMHLRMVLETLACVEAAAAMTEADFEALEARTREIAAAVDRNQYFAAAQSDLEFHRSIWRKSGNSTLYGMLDQLIAPLFAYASMERRNRRENLAQAMLPHEPVVQALRAGDPESIAAAVRAQIVESYSHLLESSAGNWPAISFHAPEGSR